MPLAFIVSAAFGLFYFLVERSGLFREFPASYSEILYSLPFLINALVLLGLFTIHILRKQSSKKTGKWLPVVSALLIVVGLWTSYLTGFHADFIITEGQEIASSIDNTVPGSVRIGRLARMPELGLSLKGVVSASGKKGKLADEFQGDFILGAKRNKQPVQFKLTNRFPRFYGGSMFLLTDIGYSPRFVLSEKNGQVLDSAFVYMKLAPPGREDYFRIILPHTFYLQYYPAGIPGKDEDVIKLRIARNKDLIYSGSIRLGEKIPFDNGIVSIDEVRQWTKLSISRDYGIPVAVLGFCLGLVECLTYLVRRGFTSEMGRSA